MSWGRISPPPLVSSYFFIFAMYSSTSFSETVNPFAFALATSSTFLTLARSLDATLKSIDRQLNDDSMVQQDLRDSLRELSKAAAEARVFLEYQTRYPEALIKGKAKEE